VEFPLELPHSVETRSERETAELGRRLAKGIRAPAVVLLRGELGAGKTALTRGLAEGWGVADASMVHSPTFSLVNVYPYPAGRIYHVDLYRLETLRDFRSIDLDQLLQPVNDIVVVEWAEKIPWRLPGALRIDISVLSDERRRFDITWGDSRER